jgi:nucleotide-binding universal stress UspA family protein
MIGAPVTASPAVPGANGGYMYRTILIPLENSAADQTIIDHIKPLAKLMGSKLILIHVADGFAARHQEDLNLAPSQEMQEDQQYLNGRQEELQREGYSVQTKLACGDPSQEIIAAADHEHCDLIAMSTHGHRMVKDLILGSVASSVRHRTDIPVLMIRAKTSGESA